VSSVARNSLKLSFFTIVSRVLGLVRDHFQAIFFGTGPVAAAWEVAYMLPNMLRNLLAEGTLAQAFIPVYSRALADGEAEARRVAGVILGFLFLLLAALVAFGVWIMPHFLPVFTGQSREEASLLIELAQVMFVFILTASLTAILAGVANAHDHFSMPALSPILLNAAFISGYVWLSGLDLDDAGAARRLAYVVVIGGVLQLVVQAAYVYVQGWRPRLALRLRDPALWKIFSLMAPAVLGASLFQINQLTDIAIASYFIPEEIGAIPALRFSQRLIQLPTGVIGVALSTAVLPALALSLGKSLARQTGEPGDETSGGEREAGAERSRQLEGALSFALFLTAPAGFALFFLGRDIINLIFYGGAWNLDSTSATWLALQFYAIGVPFFSLNKILTAAFYAHQDTRTPVRLLGLVAIVNFSLNIILVHSLHQSGIAIASACGSLVNTVTLFFFLGRRHMSIDFRTLAGRLARQALLWGGLIAWFWFAELVLRAPADALGASVAAALDSEYLPRYAGGAMFLLSGVPGGAGYLILAFLTRQPDLDVFRDWLRRRRS